MHRLAKKLVHGRSSLVTPVLGTFELPSITNEPMVGFVSFELVDDGD